MQGDDSAAMGWREYRGNGVHLLAHAFMTYNLSLRWWCPSVMRLGYASPKQRQPDCSYTNLTYPPNYDAGVQPVMLHLSLQVTIREPLT